MYPLMLSSLPAERMRGLRFSENFWSSTTVARNEWTLYNAPTVDKGITLNGTSQYATRALNGVLNNDELTIEIEFYPNFAANDNTDYFLVSSTNREYRLRKSSNNTLYINLGNTEVVAVAIGDYQTYWLENERNLLTVSAKTGDTKTYLNGVLLATDTVAWTPTDETTLNIGRAPGWGRYYDGKITDFRVGHYLATEQEHVDRWNNDTWKWNNESKCVLQMRTADYDPTGAAPADIIIDGNMEAVGVAAWAASDAVASKQVGTPHGGTQCLRSTASAAVGIKTPRVFQSPLIVGIEYNAYGWVRSDGTEVPLVRSAGTLLFTGTTSTDWQYFNVTFTALSTNFNIAFQVTDPAGTEYIEIDDVTVDNISSPKTLDSSGNGNNSILGDGSTPTTYPTQGAGRMTFDGGDYLVIPANATLPAGTYTVLATVRATDIASAYLYDARLGGGTGYCFANASNQWQFDTGALYIDGVGPYATTAKVADTNIHTMAMQGITLDMATSLSVFARNNTINFMAGDLFDFRIAPGTLTPTQINDYHQQMVKTIGAQA